MAQPLCRLAHKYACYRWFRGNADFWIDAAFRQRSGGAVHIVAGIITGVGFLGAGVIIHEGVTVKGFHTAATLWCSVAVGLFAGAGYFIAALILAGFITLVNTLLRPVVYYLNEKTDAAAQSRKNGKS